MDKQKEIEKLLEELKKLKKKQKKIDKNSSIKLCHVNGPRLDERKLSEEIAKITEKIITLRYY